MLVMRGELSCKLVSIVVVWFLSSLTSLGTIKGQMDRQTDTSSDIVTSLAAHFSE